MVLAAAMGTLSDRRIGDVLAWHTNDERYRAILKHRMQRRRGGDKVQRSYSCEDLALMVGRENDPTNPRTAEGGYVFKRTSSSRDRNRNSSDESRPESPERRDFLDVPRQETLPSTRGGGKKTKRGQKTKREKRCRVRDRTRTVSFPANSLLHYAVLQNDLAMAAKLLESSSVDADMLSKEGTAPLHEAAINGLTECVEVLLKHGADVNVLDAEGYTPLEYAVYAGQFDCASLLIELGANVAKIRDGCSFPMTR